MAGKPFQSKLTPHFDLIATMRRQQKSWREIVDHLVTLGIKTDKGNLCAFFKRHRTRSSPLGMEDTPASRQRTKPLPTAPSEDRNLSDLLSPPSEFEEGLLSIRPKKMWSIITPTQNP